MKVILLRDVARLGKRFAVVEVPDGYALNQLIPKGMVEAATAENLKRVGARVEKQATTKVSNESDFTIALAALKDSPVVMTVQANAQGHLFKAVKAGEIAAATEASGHAIPVDAIQTAEPIKSLGDHQIVAKLGSMHGEFTLTLVSK